MSTKIILILFIISNTFFGAFYFSDIAKEYGTNENKNNIAVKPITETNEQLKTDYNIDTNSIESFFTMEGTNIINQNGVISSPVILEDSYKSNPFRYTEVTFILTAFFSYTYATYLTLGLTSIENANVITTTGRSRYKTLWISSTLFEITAGLFCGAAVAYDSYQRVYGKKKNDGFSFSFVPFYEPINKDAGFVFSLNHPL